MKIFYKQFFVVLLGSMLSLSIIESCSTKKQHNITSLENKEEENDEYDGPDKAAEFEYNRTKDPATGVVPRDKMWAAVLQTEALKSKIKSNRPGTGEANALAPLTWVERGSNTDVNGPFGNSRPGNAGPTSGRMRAMWVDLADPTGNTVWVGGVDGGIWKTNDVSVASPSWTLVNDYLSNLSISSICQDPTNTNTMYFATGEAYFTGGAVNGNGVFKSTDHGITWSLLANTSTLTKCTKILCDAAGNVYVSTMGISQAVALQRSTNGGSTWVSINPFTAPITTATSRIVDFEISSNGTMHVVGGLSSAAGTGGYKYTSNPATATASAGWNDAAVPYTIPTGSGARVDLTCTGNIVYVAISTADKIDNIGKSTDGGANWTTTALTATNITDLNGGGQGSYSNTIGVDPSNPNTVIVGSLRLLKSTDGGTSFSKISEWAGSVGQYVHADHHLILWPDNGNKLIIGTDGGIFFSADKGTTFFSKNNGLRLKQFYGVAMHPTSLNYFLCGAQDNGTHQFNGAGLTSSVEVLGGDGGITGIDQDEPLFQTGAYVYANFRRSSNGGASWSSSGSSSQEGQFIDPYDLDNINNIVYAGYTAGQYLKWDNPHSGFNFIPVSIAAFNGSAVTSVTVSPFTANRVYFGVSATTAAQTSKVIMVENADQAAPIGVDISPVGSPPTAVINSVNTGISDQDLLLTYTNYGVSNIWSTTNGGTSWVACDGNLPDMPVYWALFHPDGDTKAYIATETGVWSTDLLNGAATIWTPEPTFPTVKTTVLKYRALDRTIAASTYGRGLWTSTIPNTSCTPASITTQPANSNICSGTNTTFTTVAGGSTPLAYQWQLSTAGAGGPWNNITNGGVYTGATSATLSITGATTALNNYQYRLIITGNCAPLAVTSNAVILTVTALPAAPTVSSPVNYCQNATPGPLSATGTGLLWYTTATGGTGSATAPTPATTATGTTNYYVSQTSGTCEGPRATIAVNITAIPAAPTANTTISYCQNAIATALTATGTSLLWYTVATAGTGSITAPVPSTNTIGSTNYYVSQTSGTCESTRTTITVNITATTAAPVVTSPLNYCQNAIATALTATGTGLLWYTAATGGPAGSATAPVPSTNTIGSTVYYVSQTSSCGESVRASITVTVNAAPAAPLVSTPLTYCQNATATALTATGSNLLWYTAATGGTGSTTAPIPTTSAAGSTTTYYVSQTSGCESPRSAIVVNVTAIPAAPGVTTPVTYCQNTIASALTASGTNLLWYANATGGTGLATSPTPSTAAVGSTIYYVSQSTGTCEGPRAAITVSVIASTTAPTVITPVTYCQNATASALTATGSNLLWYTQATGGPAGSATAPVPPTTSTGSSNYYVSQTTSCGEGPRALITVTVNVLPAAPTATTPIAYCQNTTATALTATGSNLLWYIAATGGTGSATPIVPATNTVGSSTYYVSQSNSGCEGPRTAIVVNITATPAAPAATTAVSYCKNAQASALIATGTNLLWYTVATGGTGSATAIIPNTTTAGTFIYYVSQSSGTCESPRTAITVTINDAPAAPLATTTFAYCQNTVAAQLSATGTTLLWYTTATGGTGNPTAPTPSTTTAGIVIYYVSQSNSCGESARTPITINITVAPAAPINLTVTGVTETTASLSWTGTAGNFYTIQYKTAAATTWITAATGITATTISIAGLTRGETYNWRVNANCTATVATVFATGSFTTISRNSTITATRNGFGLKISPSPVRSAAVIDYLIPGNGTVTLVILNSAGQVTKQLVNASFNAGQYELNITNQFNNITSGSYFLKISQNGKSFSLKFVKY